MDSDQEAEDDFREGWEEEENDSEANAEEPREASGDEDALSDDVAEDQEVDDSGDEEFQPEEDELEEEQDDDSEDDATTQGALDASEQTDLEDEVNDLFESTADAEQLLQGMAERGVSGPSKSMQPYQLMGIQRQLARGQEQPSKAQPSKGRGQAKKARKDAGAVFGADVDADMEDADLAEQMKLGPIKGKAKRMRDREKRRAKNAAAGKRTKLMPEEAMRKMGEATLAYAGQRYPEAMTLLWDVIRLAPNMPDAYHTLGALHENTHDPRKAINFYIIAAHLNPKDVGLWKRLAAMSAEVDPPMLQQALYCLNRVVVRDKDDMDAKWDRAMLLSRLNQPRKAIQALEHISELQPQDGEVSKMLARLHYRLGDSSAAQRILQELLDRHESSADLTHVNMLCELLMRSKQPQRVLTLIQGTAFNMCGDEGLPVELQAKAGVCAVQVGDIAQAEVQLAALLEVDPAEMPDLFQDSVDALLEAGYPAQATELYRQMITVPHLNVPELWEKLSAAFVAAGDHDSAADVFRERAQEDHQDLVALTMRRAQLFRTLGREEEYMQLMLPLVNSTLDRMEAPAGASTAAAAAAVQSSVSVPPPAAAGADAGGAALQRSARKAAEAEALIKGPGGRRRKPPNQRGKEAAQKPLPDTESRPNGKAQVKKTGRRAKEATRQGRGRELGNAAHDREQFEAVVRAARALLTSGRLEEAADMAQRSSSLFACKDRSRNDALQLVLASVSLLQGDADAAMQACTRMVRRWPKSNVVWNTFCRVGAAKGQLPTRVVAGIKARTPDCLHAALLLGSAHSLAAQHMPLYQRVLATVPPAGGLGNLGQGKHSNLKSSLGDARVLQAQLHASQALLWTNQFTIRSTWGLFAGSLAAAALLSTQIAAAENKKLDQETLQELARDLQGSQAADRER
ncbi:hypothetical protein WJX73_002044, partial [Symbiochloris irregularis]